MTGSQSINLHVPLAAFDLTVVLVAVLGGGFLTGLVALLRYRTDKDSVIVTSAQGAVVIQSGVITALKDELERVRTERNEDVAKCAAENTAQTEKIKRLEAEIAELRECLQKHGIT